MLSASRLLDRRGRAQQNHDRPLASADRRHAKPPVDMFSLERGYGPARVSHLTLTDPTGCPMVGSSTGDVARDTIPLGGGTT